jgi:hypothetical protein
MNLANLLDGAILEGAILEGAFSRETCLRLTLTLLHFLWQACAVALLVLAAGWCLRRRSAGARYAVNVGGLLLMAACVPFTFATVTGGTIFW